MGPCLPPDRMAKRANALKTPTTDRVARRAQLTWRGSTQLIVDLATYERAADQVRSTPEQLHEALFGPQPAAYALVAEADGAVVGFALYFRNFSTWEGVHGIYLEDLFVAPEQRARVWARRCWPRWPRIAVERGYARLEWAVLDWNQPAIDFYRGLGAVPMDEWTVFRLDGPALQRVATAPPRPEARRAVPTGR